MRKKKKRCEHKRLATAGCSHMGAEQDEQGAASIEFILNWDIVSI